MLTVSGTARDHVIVDETHYPALLSKFHGTVTVELMRFYFAWSMRMHERAETDETQIIQIVDALSAEVAPAHVRREVARLSDEHTVRFKPLMLTSFVCLSSPLVRGTMSAINWLSRERMNITAVKTLPTAIVKTLRAFEEAGIAPPQHLSPMTYEFPLGPGSDRSSGSSARAGGTLRD